MSPSVAISQSTTAWIRSSLADQAVVEPVVAVHDPEHRRVAGLDGRHAARQLPVQLVGVGVLARLGALQLLAPPAHLSLEEPLRPAELAQPDRVGVDRVQRGQHVDQPPGHRRGPLGTERVQLGGPAVGDPSTRSIT